MLTEQLDPCLLIVVWHPAENNKQQALATIAYAGLLYPHELGNLQAVSAYIQGCQGTNCVVCQLVLLQE